MTQLKVKLLNKDAKVPTYGSEQAGAFDFYATEDAVLMPVSSQSKLMYDSQRDEGKVTIYDIASKKELRKFGGGGGFFDLGFDVLKEKTFNPSALTAEQFDNLGRGVILQVFYTDASGNERYFLNDAPSRDYYIDGENNGKKVYSRKKVAYDTLFFYTPVSYDVSISDSDKERLSTLMNLDKTQVDKKGRLIVPVEKVLVYRTHCFYMEQEVLLNPVSVGTGIALQLEPDEVLNVRPRSGLWFKHGVTVFGGTIDADYRGEIKISMYNTSSEPFKVEKGMRIAQGIITKFEKKEMVVVDELDDTARGIGGFASTGLK